jgi:sugar phosphate isomerase/epimerase
MNFGVNFFVIAAPGLEFAMHACENDRGVPGTGQVRWQHIAAALKDVKHDRSLLAGSSS